MLKDSRVREILNNIEKYDTHRTMLTELEGAQFLGISHDTLRDLRLKGLISFIAYTSPHPRARPMVRYRLSALQKYQAKHEHSTEADAA